MSYRIKVPAKVDPLDEAHLLTGVERFLLVLQEQRRAVLVGLGVLLVAAAVVAGVIWYDYQATLKARDLDQEATLHYLNRPADDPKKGHEQLAQAINLYKQVVDQYPRSPVAPLALFHLGNAQVLANEVDAGIETYKRFMLLHSSNTSPLVDSIFSEFQLPSDLIYLSLVESGFNPHAYSRARAAGPWQFMKGTAKVYGLRVDSYVDERRDPVKSTVAAARYLRDLYDLFGTWPLAMAAYNAGEGKVMRALHTAQAESFSDIAKTRLIRRETKEYVPRFMAATIIAKNPDRYGFPQNDVRPHQFEEVVVKRPIHFKAIANVTGISYQELKVLNPELRRDATPPDDSEYHLKVPVGTREKVEQLLDRAPTHKFTPLPVPVRVRHVKPEPESGHWYRVRVGDSLERIAKRFNISVKTLKSNNNLTGPTIKAGSRLVIAN